MVAEGLGTQLFLLGVLHYVVVDVDVTHCSCTGVDFHSPSLVQLTYGSHACGQRNAYAQTYAHY